MKKTLLFLLIILLAISCSSSLSKGNMTMGEKTVLFSGEKFSGKKEGFIQCEKATDVSMTLDTKGGKLKVKVTSPSGENILEGSYGTEWNQRKTTSFSAPQGKNILVLEGDGYTGEASFSWQ